MTKRSLKAAKKRAEAKKAVERARVAKVVVTRVEKLDDEHHAVAFETEVHGPLPSILAPEALPIEISAEDQEPAKRSLWAWFWGK
jgi:hypothetical protein